MGAVCCFAKGENTVGDTFAVASSIPTLGSTEVAVSADAAVSRGHNASPQYDSESDDGRARPNESVVNAFDIFFSYNSHAQDDADSVVEILRHVRPGLKIWLDHEMKALPDYL